MDEITLASNALISNALDEILCTDMTTKRKILPAKLIPRRSVNVIEVSSSLPLEETVQLEFQGKEYIIPAEFPVYGIFQYYDKIIIAQLEEEPQRLSRSYKLGDSVNESTVHLLQLEKKGYRRVGEVRLKETAEECIIHGGIEPTEYLLSLSPLTRFFVNDIRHDLDTLVKKGDAFARLVARLTEVIALLRYKLPGEIVNSYEHTTGQPATLYYKYADIGWISVMTDVVKKMFSLKETKSTRTIQGYIPHNDVQFIEGKINPIMGYAPFIALDKINENIIQQFKLREEIEVVLNDKLYRVSQFSPRKDSASILNPIVGMYTHPFDDDKIVFTRFVQLFSDPNSFILLVKEVSPQEKNCSEEKLIGEAWARVEEDGIYCHDFKIEKYHDSEKEAQQYRGKGLGSCVLHSLELVTCKYFNKDKLIFESVPDYSHKENIRHNPGKFFGENDYRRICEERHQKISPYHCDFEKKFIPNQECSKQYDSRRFFVQTQWRELL